VVIAVDVNPRALGIARKMGADHRIDAGRQGVVAAVKAVAPEGADTVFECMGIPACIVAAIPLCRTHGSFVWQGNYGAAPVSMHFLLAHGRRLQMSFPCDDGLAPCRRAVVKNIAWVPCGGNAASRTASRPTRRQRCTSGSTRATGRKSSASSFTGQADRRRSEMSTILVTGASGFIGQALAPSLAERHEVICMSRSNPRLGLPWVRAYFGAFEDLRALDSDPIDAVVHLAAVTGGCLERDGILVNVEGTRCMMRYLIDRGCEKFVFASSIAAVGFQNVRFRPLELPISDEHPCLDRDGYGFSKYMMEQIIRYYWRQNEQIDAIVLRLATVTADENMPAPLRISPLRPWALGGLTKLARSDAVRAFTMAIEAPQAPGVRIMNTAGPRAWAADPVADILANWWGDEVDLSYYRQPGHEYDAVYDVRRIERELGFVAERLP
jgi:nucleoside-diphosphate-sugar epimerase